MTNLAIRSREILGTLALTFALTGSFSLNVAPAFSMTLFGNAEHVDALPPVDDTLKAMVQRQPPPNLVPEQAQSAAVPPLAPLQGNVTTLTGAVATLARPAVEWFMIPPWMAGTWSKKGDLTVSVTDLLSGRTGAPNVFTEDEMTVHWGHQIDRVGHVWHANFIPAERDGRSEGELVRFVTVAQKCEVSSPEQLVTRTRYAVTKQYVGTNQIVDMFQQESLNDYIFTNENKFDNKSSNKMFHMNGQPYRVGILNSSFTRVADFAPVPSLRGIDMRVALADYLHSRNMDELIPQPPIPSTNGF